MYNRIFVQIPIKMMDIAPDTTLSFACSALLFSLIETASIGIGIYTGFEKCTGIGCHLGVLLLSMMIGLVIFFFIPLLMSLNFAEFLLAETVLTDLVPACFESGVSCCVEICNL